MKRVVVVLALGCALVTVVGAPAGAQTSVRSSARAGTGIVFGVADDAGKFAEVAAGNPHAWSHAPYSPEEIRAVCAG